MKRFSFLIILIAVLILTAFMVTGPVRGEEMPDFSEDGADVMDPDVEPAEAVKTVSENIPVFKYYRPNE